MTRLTRLIQCIADRGGWIIPIIAGIGAIMLVIAHVPLAQQLIQIASR